MFLEVINNHRLSSDYYLLVTQSAAADQTRPGQFFHLKTGEKHSYDPLLRRPLSVHKVDRSKGRISFLYRVVGKGTKMLSFYQAGDTIDALGPLGNGFRTDFKNKQILVIGGGMGIAPLYPLVDSLINCNQVILLIGGNNQQDLKYFLDFPINSRVIFAAASIDGSIGLKGTVIDLWEKSYSAGFYPDFLFTCGPKAMLRRVKLIAEERAIPGQVSLEERMGCGSGVCLSCVCQTNKGNQRVCKEGPVFPLQEVRLNERD